MKIFKLISSTIFLVLIFSRLIEPQTFDWVKGMSGFDCTGYAISTDANGNSYVTGWFKDTAIFGTTTLTSSGYSDIFIVKYDIDGDLLWVKQAGGTGNDEGHGVSIDANGNSYIVGEFRGTAQFGSIVITSDGVCAFIAKYDDAGKCLWAKKAGGSANYGSGISTDINGNSYITGNFNGTTTFGTNTLESSGSTDIFIAKYDNGGNCLWAQRAGGASIDGGRRISNDANGNSYITGNFQGTATFGTTALTTAGGNDIFVAKYGNSGNFIWAIKAGGKGDDSWTGIFTDTNGNSYVTGGFNDTVTFSSKTLVSSGMFDIFITKYDNGGNLLWIKQAGGVYDDLGYAISCDADGNSYITGQFTGTATFDTTTVAGYGSTDIFIAKYDDLGECLWVQKAGGEGSNDNGFGISASIPGLVYITGRSYNANFGSINLLTSGGYIAKIKFSTSVPVELISFSKIVWNKKVILNWLTATEKNLQRFEIEKLVKDYYVQRSEEIMNWKKIGFVAANGSSSEQRSYSFIDNLETSGKCFYRLKQIDYDGNYTYSQELEVDLGMPTKFLLEQNYPNPFNPTTTILYALPFESNIKLVVYNLIGEVVKELLHTRVSAGYQEVRFDAANLSSGIYFYTLFATSLDGQQNYKSMKKMLLLK